MAVMKDVAKLAGVSISTVSFVLNGTAKEHKVADKTAQKVLCAARDLGYQLNAPSVISPSQLTIALFFHLSLSAQKSTSSLLQWNDRFNRQAHLLIFCSASTNEVNWKCESGTLHLPHIQQPLLLLNPNPIEMHWKNCQTRCR